jgi:polyferredoxin
MKNIVTGLRLLFLTLFLYLILTGHMLLWLALFAVSLLLSLLFGRLYCGYACPMNTLMIPTAWLSKKLHLRKEKTPKWLARGFFPWLALIVSVGALLLAKRFLHVNLPVLPFWLALSVFVTLWFEPAVFHNLICPFGVLQKTFGRFAFLSKRVVNKNCVGCRLCEGVCPSNAITVGSESKKAVISTALCHQCGACHDACKVNAITYGKKP